MIGRDEYAQRRARAVRLAAERGLDGLIAWARGGAADSFHDVYYLAGHYTGYPWVPPLVPQMTGCEQSGVVINADGEATLLVSALRDEAVAIDDVREAWDMGGELVDAVGRLGLEGGRIGLLTSEVLPDSIGQRLRDALPGLAMVPADDLSATLRRRLSDAELDMMRVAGHAGQQIWDRAFAAIEPGKTEGAAIGAGLAEAAQIPGCVHWAFLASGPDSSVLARNSQPSWVPDHVYERGAMVQADCYGWVEGYAYDLARSVVVGGDATPAQTRVMDAARGATEALAAALRPGVTCRELHRVCVDYLDDCGLAPVGLFGTQDDEAAALGPGFGHSLGAGFFRPYLIPQGADVDLPLEPPCAMAFEVFTDDGQGNCAFHEDNYLLTAQGVECITR